MNKEKVAMIDKHISGVELLKVLAHPVRLGLVETMLTNGPSCQCHHEQHNNTPFTNCQ